MPVEYRKAEEGKELALPADCKSAGRDPSRGRGGVRFPLPSSKNR